MGELAQHIVNHPLLSAGFVVLLAAVVFFEIRQRTQGALQVGPADAVRLINGGAVVIDVRSAEAYRSGHIVNSRNVEIGQIAENAALKKQKNKVLITVCDNGIVSNRAAALLRKAGFEKVFSLKGGLNGWRAENLPLVK